MLTHAATAAVAAGAAGAVTPRFGRQHEAESAPPTAPFYGEHQAGVVSDQQSSVVLAAFDVVADRSGLRGLLDKWTLLGAALSEGRPVPALDRQPAGLAADSGIAVGLGAGRFTMTVGFGPGLFDRRFGLAAQRPKQLVPLPAFPGDQLDVRRSDGDLIVQLCADDPQILSHAFLHVRAAAVNVAELRWSDAGFVSPPSDGSAPRNLLGLQDGTANPPPGPDRERLVWVDAPAEPAWLHGGTYMVFRRIRLRLPEWSLTSVVDQHKAIGRRVDGSPLSAAPGADPSTPLDLQAKDTSGNLAIPARAHVRQMHPFEMHRRSYNYDRGFDPRFAADGHDHDHGPGHHGSGHASFDAGLLFLTYNRNPGGQFIPAQRALATTDDLNQFLQTTGSGLFAIPTGIRPGRRLADDLI